MSAYSVKSRFLKRVILGSLVLFVALSLITGYYHFWKPLAISWIAFASMLIAIPIGIQAASKKKIMHLISGYGLASGAMITSSAIFLVPTAIGHDPVYGGLGLALGIMGGFAIHTFNHNLTHHSWSLDSVVIELTLHALSAGVIIGTVYAAMPELSLLLGVAIVSHKAPAGYAAARRLTMRNGVPLLVVIPATALGLSALSVTMVPLPESSIFNALVFGIATGVFFHVAIDFLPRCEVGGNIFEHIELDEEEHHRLDKFRNWAIINTFAGGIIVFLLWFINH